MVGEDLLRTVWIDTVALGEEVPQACEGGGAVIMALETSMVTLYHRLMLSVQGHQVG